MIKQGGELKAAELQNSILMILIVDGKSGRIIKLVDIQELTVVFKYNILTRRNIKC